jgi:hypothetical protein
MTHLPQNEPRKGVFVPAQNDDQTRPIAWLAITRCRSRLLDNENPAYIRRCRRGFSCFTSRKVAALQKKNVEPPASFLPLRFSWRNFLGGIRLRFRAPYSIGDNARDEQASAGSASTPERGPAGSVQRVGQGRLVILSALAFELLLSFPEASDAGCDFGPVARESFFLLSHRPSVSCLIRARHHWRARMGREWGGGLQHRDWLSL